MFHKFIRQSAERSAFERGLEAFQQFLFVLGGRSLRQQFGGDEQIVSRPGLSESLHRARDEMLLDQRPLPEIRVLEQADDRG